MTNRETLRSSIALLQEKEKVHKALADFTLEMFNLMNEDKIVKVQIKYFHPWSGQWWSRRKASEQTLKVERTSYPFSINRAAIQSMLQHHSQGHSYEMHRCAKLRAELEEKLHTLDK